jgi:hypothetical protein
MLEKVFLLNMPNFLQEHNPHILFIHLYKSKLSLLKMFMIYIAFNATYTVPIQFILLISIALRGMLI